MKMTSQDTSLNEYRSRINRVTDYMEANLDKPADLGVLAGVAHFSAYHFHRIFTFMTGETPAGFMMRLRMEKAAGLLLRADRLPVAEIAFLCGFGDASSFSRAFRRHFGIPAKEYSTRDKNIYIKDSRRFSKIGQEDSKDCKYSADGSSDLCGVELKNLIFMDTKVEIREMPSFNVIYVRHTGQFNMIKNAYEKLFRWAGPRGLLGPRAHTISVYHDDPAITSIDKVRQSACVTVDGDVKTEGEIGKMTIPGGKYAVGHFDFHGEEGFEKAWNTMCHWFTESGYEPAEGSCYEFYLGNPDEGTDGGLPHFVIDICMPVKPL